MDAQCLVNENIFVFASLWQKCVHLFYCLLLEKYWSAPSLDLCFPFKYIGINNNKKKPVAIKYITIIVGLVFVPLF